MFLVNSGIQRLDTHEFYEKRGFLLRSKGFYKRLGTAEQSVKAALGIM
jgi:hypothetical protein